MRIIVCIKQICYAYHPFAIVDSAGHLDTEKTVLMLNPYDEIAVEAAVRIKEHSDNCEVIVVTAGPPKSEVALRYALAMGADKMMRIDFESMDPWVISSVLAQAIRELNYDIILCGKKAIDSNAGQVGSCLAERLNIPQVSGIIGMELLRDMKRVLVDRCLGRGDRQVVECTLPALFTIEDGMNDPRYPLLRNRLLAESESIQVLTIGSLGIRLDQEPNLTKFMTFSPPRPRPKKVFIPDSKLSASERMQLVMSGGITKKNGTLLKGEVEDIAQKIVSVLAQENFV